MMSYTKLGKKSIEFFSNFVLKTVTNLPSLFQFSEFRVHENWVIGV